MKIRLTNVIIPFCGFYFIILPLSPIYLSYLFAFIFTFLLVIYTSSVLLNSTIVFSFFVFLSFSIFQSITGFDISALIGFLFSIAYFILSLIILNKTSSPVIIKASDRLINYSIYILTVEALWRVLHPQYYVPNNSTESGFNLLKGVYPFKISSIMYLDSNFVGLYIVCIFFFTLYLRNETGKSHKFKLLSLFFLSVLTFSRGAIISIVLFYLVFKYIYLIKRIRIIYIILGLFSFVMALIYVYGSFSNDESFKSKFYVINSALDYFENAGTITKFLGVGFGNTSKYLHMGAHNIFITYLFESGIIGSIILLSFWLYISIITHHKILIVLIPFVFAGFALTTHAIPYLYCIFAIIYTIRKNKVSEEREIVLHKLTTSV